MKYSKKIASLFLVLVILCTFSSTIFAFPPDTIYWNPAPYNFLDMSGEVGADNREDVHTVVNMAREATAVELYINCEGGLATLTVLDVTGNHVLDVYGMLGEPGPFAFTMEADTEYTFRVSAYRDTADYTLTLIPDSGTRSFSWNPQTDDALAVNGRVGYYDYNNALIPEDLHYVYNTSEEAVCVEMSVWTNGGGLSDLNVFDSAGNEILVVYNMFNSTGTYTFTMEPYTSYTFRSTAYKGLVDYTLTLRGTASFG